ncbi:PEGA domain-containing protein [Sorangium sp. So ce1389]|uniref:PEGA domain-containing protein n=1 Tax=Sorangium sp. So ce1389 TaxID=3133336 RepID=UPI003F61E57C
MTRRAMRARAAGWWVLVLGWAAAPAAAQAQDGPASAQGVPASAEAAQASREADAAFARGKELYRLGKLDAAYEQYRTAWSLKQSYDIAANLANTELQRGMKVEAAEHLAFCLRSFPATGNAAQHEQIRAQFRAVRKEVGSIVVKVNADGAEVSFDGTAVGRTPFRHEVFVKPGTIAVQARLAGYEPARVTLEVPAGETNTADLTLLPLERPAPSAPPAPRAEVPAPVAPEGADTVGPQPEVLIAGGAVAGAGVIAGVVFTIVAVAKSDEAGTQRDALVRENGPGACTRASAPAACSVLRDADDGHIRAANGAILSFAAAGAIGAGTAIYWLATRPSASQQGVRATPAVGASGFGVTVSGEF